MPIGENWRLIEDARTCVDARAGEVACRADARADARAYVWADARAGEVACKVTEDARGEENGDVRRSRGLGEERGGSEG